MLLELLLDDEGNMELDEDGSIELEDKSVELLELKMLLDDEEIIAALFGADEDDPPPPQPVKKAIVNTAIKFPKKDFCCILCSLLEY